MKKILVFSNREQIGDGLIKLPFVKEIKLRYPDYLFIWATNSGPTVYNNQIKNIASEYIDVFFEKIPLINYFLRSKSENYDLSQTFDIVIDTQKSFLRSLAIRSLKSNLFVSSSANWLLSDIKPDKKVKKNNNYYLEDLFFILNLISYKKINNDDNIKIPKDLNLEIKKIFSKEKKYFGFAPGSAGTEKIWDIKNFIKVAKYFEKKNYIPTFYLGPLEKNLKEIILTEIPKAFFPEDLLENFNGPEVVYKIIGPTTTKFTPKKNNFIVIDSKDFHSSDVNTIKSDYVISKIEKNIYL